MSISRAWWRQMGTVHLPVRQSLLNEHSSQNGCPRRFFFRMEEELSGQAPAAREHLPWKRTLGTAIHRCIERALIAAPQAICDGRLPARERVCRVLDEELRSEAAGVPVDWADSSGTEREIQRAADMVLGGLRTLGARAARIVAVEAPFRLELAGYHIEGEIDLVFAPKEAPLELELADWKSGQRRLEQVVRDHGVQLGVYGAALAHGELWPGTERATRLERAPREMWIVQLYDFVPYEKPRKKSDIGAPRGPGWYRSRRASDDLARLEVSLRSIVGEIRRGGRTERVGEQCGRCPYRAQCLSVAADAPSKGELRAVESALEEIPDLDELIPRVA